MSIKIQGQTVVDSNKNIVDVNSATFDGDVAIGGGLQVDGFITGQSNGNIYVNDDIELSSTKELKFGGGNTKISNDGTALTIDILSSEKVRVDDSKLSIFSDVIKLNYDGSADFAGGDLTINNSGNVLCQRSGSSGFVKLTSTGLLKVRGAATGSVFTIEDSATSLAKVDIMGDGSATFDNYVTSKEGFYVSQTSSPTGASLFKSWYGGNTYIDIFDNGSTKFGPINISSSTGYGAHVDMAANAATVKAQCQQTASQYTELFAGYMGANKHFSVNAGGDATFAGTVDAAGFTVNGAALSTGGGDVSTLVETATGTTIAEAKTDSDGDRVLDLNKVVIGVDLGAMHLGKDEVNTPWQQGIYMDGTDASNNDKTRVILYGNGSSDAAFQIVDGANSKSKVYLGHHGLGQFGVETDFTSGINISPKASPDNQSNIDVYGDGTSTSTAFRVYNGTASKDMLWLNHDGNAAFNLDNQNWSEGIRVQGNHPNGANVSVYNDGTKTYSAFRVYDSAAGHDKINLYHDGNAGFNLDVQNWDQGVKIFGKSQYGSGVTVYRDSTISAHTGAVFRAYDKATDTNPIAFYGNGNGFFKGLVEAENVFSKGALYAHTEGTGQVTVWKGANADDQSCGVGWSALAETTSGAENNTAMGTGGLQNLTTGVRNTALGANAGRGGSSATFNECTAIGPNALYANVSGSRNIAIGPWALASNIQSNDCIAIGRSALYDVTDEGSYNIAIGTYGLHNCSTGDNNVALGYRAGFNLTSDSDTTSIGHYASYSNVSGNTRSTAIGSHAMYNSTGGYENTAVGYTALYNNNYAQSSAFGAFAGRYDTSGNDSASFYDTTCIGYNSRASGHYQVVLGDTNAYTYTNGGSVYSLSDARDKTDVRDTIMGLDFIKSLRPVDYRWDYREDYLQFDPETGNHNPVPRDGSKKRTRFHHGLIAQEVKSAADQMGVDFAGFQDHTINGGEERMTLGYSEFIGPLIKAVQELSEENAALKARLDAAGL